MLRKNKKEKCFVHNLASTVCIIICICPLLKQAHVTEHVHLRDHIDDFIGSCIVVIMAGGCAGNSEGFDGISCVLL